MKTNLRQGIILMALSLTISATYSQIAFTPYDDIPGVIKSYKPAYNTSLPYWAQMLYYYPINYYEIDKGFELYISQNPGLKSPEIRYYKIWQRAIGPYVMDDGSIKLPDIELYNKELLNLQRSIREDGEPVSRSDSDWTFLGPKETYWLNESGSPNAPNACPWQVNVYSFDVAPTNDNVLYCGTETGFVNKTTNKGVNWQLMAPDYYFGGGVTAVAIDPTNEDVVFVTAGNQVHKTIDGGDSWSPLLSVGSLFQTNRIKINPNNPNLIFAAATTGVFKSNNGGDTWTQSLPLPTYDIEFKTDDSDWVYAISKENGRFSVYMSGDGGNSFIPQLDFPDNIVDISGGLLAVTENNPNIMLAVMLSSNNTPLLYKGELIGASWIWELMATGQTGSFQMNNGQGYFDLVLEISPLDENLIFTGTTTLFKSSNGGQQFTATGGYSGNFLIHPDIQDMKLLVNGET